MKEEEEEKEEKEKLCWLSVLDKEIVSPGTQVSKLVAQRVFGNL